MNLLKVISNDEPIGGLEISDNSLRFCLLKKDHSGLKTEVLIEEKLSEKENLNDEAAFVSKLSKFTKKNKIKYVIISIPSSDVFIKTYTFPGTMPEGKIEESMELAISLQLPQKPEDIYCDWMTISEKDEKLILLSYVNKKRINNLIAILNKVGLRIVAIENRAMSLARAISQPKDEAILAIEKENKDTSFSVITNNHLIFAQSIPNDKLSKDLGKEIRQIINYYDWLNTSLKGLILIGDFENSEIKKLPLPIADTKIFPDMKQFPKESKWLVALGSALRGLTPRKDDKMISLMEIGTEKAYKREKAKSIINFFIGITAALSIFFAVVFFATWSFVLTMQNNYNRQITSFSLLPATENNSVLREKADAFNSLIGQMSILIDKEPRWSKVIEEAKSKAVSGVVVNNLTLPSADGVFSMTGTAENREAINQLKKSFESSAMFDNIDIPLTNLGKKNDIPFSMSFKIKNSELIYTK
jgi:hypothetical protein